MRFQKLAAGSNNICISRAQANEDLLDKLDTITSCIKNTKAIFKKKDNQKFKIMILQKSLKMKKK